MPEDSISPLPTSLLQTTQTATTRVSYVRGYREKKNKPKPNQPTLQSSNADGVTHTATQFFPQIFLLRNATESSVPLPESLTIDCFSLAFLWFHLHSELLLYNASNSSKKDGAVSIQSQLPAVYITAMQTEKIWILSGWKKKKESNICTSWTKGNHYYHLLSSYFFHYNLRKIFCCCMHVIHLFVLQHNHTGYMAPQTSVNTVRLQPALSTPSLNHFFSLFPLCSY